MNSMKTRRKIWLILIILGFSWFSQSNSFIDLFLPDENIPHPSAVELTQGRMEHILYGDNTGGGHLYGTGKPCKSEFPENWDSAQIIETVEQIAANDNLKWRKELNGYYTAEEKIDGIKVRVVLSDTKGRIITAYPVNVKRNPCDTPYNDIANDNDPIR